MVVPYAYLGFKATNKSKRKFAMYDRFLDALASLKTMLDIKLPMFSGFQDYKISRVLPSMTECYSVLQSITE